MPRSARKKQLQRERAKADTRTQPAADGSNVLWAFKLVANGHTFYRAGRDSHIWRPVDGSDSLILGPEDMQPGSEDTEKLYYVAKLGGLDIQDYFSECKVTDADVQVEIDFSRWGFIEGAIKPSHLMQFPMKLRHIATEMTGTGPISSNAREDALNTIRTQIFGAEYAPFEYR